MKFAIVTGASRGLGEEVAKNVIQQGYHLFTISRKRKTNELKNLANENRKSYYHHSCDLSDLEKLNDTLYEIITKLQGQTVEELLIVNNAGMVAPIGPVGSLESHDIARHVSVNLTSLMIIVNTIKKHVNANRLFVVNVSSGAGERAVYGWNAYCSTKSAVNLYTQTAALEAEETNSKDLHIAFSPGIMDTDMQKEIRSTDEEDFKNVEQFKQYKEEGQLRSPKEVADILTGLIQDKEAVKNGKVYKVYDLVK
ncbi:(S)-benzoin forming benzil reductase [Aquisalibacillus elongatus]|uniref:Benzil reductase ((S)-benzoin forming) n=1 Tax=Aquisalibacillus elongatus TaxID=485577 RepID=A0A3N5CEA6_9BACI|nr:(S)-benzoin forming benzil reductase [Aquisalibacillus elongatus]RPF55511.1 benzil reductase ((S)-benzoin forming) [Aquisalibacillus elongatus]